MAIKNRQGKSQDFVPNKLLGGEFAVVQEGDENTADGSALYLATKAGSVKRIPFASEVEDLQSSVDSAVADAREAIASAIDPTLTQSGKAADAKKTGDEIADLKSDLSKVGLSESVKRALLNVVSHIAIWTDEHGQDYYDDLEMALYEVTYPRIIAEINTGSHIVCTDDTPSTLKPYITVKYYETKESAGIIVPSEQIAVAGIIKAGTSIIRVSYNDLSTNINVETANCIPSVTVLNTVAPTNVTVDSQIEVCVNANTNINRAMGITLEESPHYLMYNNNNPSQYYPMHIPTGAKKVWLENAIQGKLFYSFYIVKWDDALGKWIKQNNSPFRCCQEYVTFTDDTDLDSLTPWMDDLGDYSDGNYYILFNAGNTSGTTDSYTEFEGAVAVNTPGPISDVSLSRLQPHFVFNV